MEVVPSDNEGTGHLGGNNTASQDTATNRDVASEGALLVYLVVFNKTQSNVRISQQGSTRTDIGAVDSLRGSLEAETDILVPPLLLGRDLLATYKSTSRKQVRHKFSAPTPV